MLSSPESDMKLCIVFPIYTGEMMKLTDVAIKKAKPEAKSYTLSDGNGLWLLVEPNSSKYWRLKYRIAG